MKIRRFCNNIRNALLSFVFVLMSISLHSQDQPTYINTILEYLNTNQHKYVGNINDKCYPIYRKKGIDKSSCYYKLWNDIYYCNYIADSINTFKKLKEANGEIDYTQIKPLLQDTSAVQINLDNIDYCVKIVDKITRGTYTFSPLIPFHTKNRFEVWLTIGMSREDFYYLFRLTKKGDQYIVSSHEFEDFCFTPYDSGDWLKDLDTIPDKE